MYFLITSKIYLDNCFTNTELIREFKKMEIPSIATVRYNRLKNCMSSSNEEMRKGNGVMKDRYKF